MRIIKRLLLQILLFLLLFFLILFPKKSLSGAGAGLLLWFQTMLPTLLPFIILSNLLMAFDLTGPVTALTAPVLKKLLGISQNGCYPVTIGLLCGYPMGAKATADMWKKGALSLSEADYILSFCNNASPGYVFGFIYVTCLGMKLSALRLALLFYGPIFLFAFTYRLLLSLRRRTGRVDINNLCQLSAQELSSQDSSFCSAPFMASVDDAIMNGFEVMVRLGGYMMLFSILGEVITLLPGLPESARAFFMLFNEITTGSERVAACGLPARLKTAAILTGTSFGGLSCLAQTSSMIKGTPLSLARYAAARACIGAIAFLLAMAFGPM